METGSISNKSQQIESDANKNASTLENKCEKQIISTNKSSFKKKIKFFL